MSADEQHQVSIPVRLPQLIERGVVDRSLGHFTIILGSAPVTQARSSEPIRSQLRLCRRPLFRVDACDAARGTLYPRPMSTALKQAPATIADLLAIPEPERFHEIIDGEVVRKAMPSPRHGRSQARLTMRLGGPYDRKPGGKWPGGWRFLTETEIQFEDSEVYRPDVAGWRRERLPELPAASPLLVRPDWVCEILSPSNERNDVVKKMRAYKRSSVPHYWLLDPIAETLIVYRWTEKGYLLVLAAQEEERINAEPFEATTFSVHGLLDGDDED